MLRFAANLLIPSDIVEAFKGTLEEGPAAGSLDVLRLSLALILVRGVETA